MMRMDDVVKASVGLLLVVCAFCAILFAIPCIGYAWDGMYEHARSFALYSFTATSTGLFSFIGLCIYSVSGEGV